MCRKGKRGGVCRWHTIAFELVIARDGRHGGADGRGVARQRISVDLLLPKRSVVCALRGEEGFSLASLQRAGKTRFGVFSKANGLANRAPSGRRALSGRQSCSARGAARCVDSPRDPYSLP